MFGAYIWVNIFESNWDQTLYKCFHSNVPYQYLPKTIIKGERMDFFQWATIVIWRNCLFLFFYFLGFICRLANTEMISRQFLTQVMVLYCTLNWDPAIVLVVVYIHTHLYFKNKIIIGEKHDFIKFDLFVT